MNVRPADEIALEAAMSEITKRVAEAETQNDVEQIAFHASRIRDAATKLQHLANCIVSETRSRAMNRELA